MKATDESLFICRNTWFILKITHVEKTIENTSKSRPQRGKTQEQLRKQTAKV